VSTSIHESAPRRGAPRAHITAHFSVTTAALSPAFERAMLPVGPSRCGRRTSCAPSRVQSWGPIVGAVAVRSAKDVPGQPRRLWVSFQSDLPAVVGVTGTDPLTEVLMHGCGVTGLDEADCWRRVRALFGDRPVPPFREVVLDVDVSTLDLPVVRTGIGDPAALGVWFPKRAA
jgi:hypothetical protein